MRILIFFFSDQSQVQCGLNSVCRESMIFYLLILMDIMSNFKHSVKVLNTYNFKFFFQVDMLNFWTPFFADSTICPDFTSSCDEGSEKWHRNSGNEISSCKTEVVTPINHTTIEPLLLGFKSCDVYFFPFLSQIKDAVTLCELFSWLEKQVRKIKHLILSHHQFSFFIWMYGW